MKIKEIRVSFSRTVSPRQYNPVRIEVSETIEIADESVKEVRSKIYKKLKKFVDSHCEQILEDEAEE